jgi:3',5'-cyclic AMP phosphodiesterase CpdA
MRPFQWTGKLIRDHPIKAGLAFACILAYIPIQIWNYYAPLAISNWNRSQVSRIKVADPDDFTFAVFGDNKEGYYLFDVLLKDINHRNQVSFATSLGDSVPKGDRGHFRRFLKEVQADLATPLVTSIGNHDLYHGSSDNYRKIFGETYYSFQIGENYFIVLDATTEAGLDRSERRWLEEELKKAQASTNRFVFMHVSPFDPRGDGFDKCLRDGKEIMDLFRAYDVTHLFASHIHGYFSGVWEGVPYTITGGGGSKLQGDDPDHFFHHFVTVRVQKGNVEATVNRIDTEHAVAAVFDMFEDYVLEWGLLLPPAVAVLGVLMAYTRKKKGFLLGSNLP